MKISFNAGPYHDAFAHSSLGIPNPHMNYILNLLKYSCWVLSRVSRDTRGFLRLLWNRVALASATGYGGTVGQLPFLWDCIHNIRYLLVHTPDEYLQEAREQHKNAPKVYIPIQTGTEIIYEEYLRSSLPEPG